MIAIERQALHALEHCSMRLASNGKRFRNDISLAAKADPGLKLTAKQALLLWDLIFTYRRQVQDPVLLAHGTHVRNTDTLPDIYQSGDHREAKGKTPRPRRQRSSRYQNELKRGGGRLKL